MSFRRGLVTIFTIVLATTLVVVADARDWHTTTGQTIRDATFAGINSNGQVQLLTRDGDIHPVPLAELSQEDRKLIAALLEDGKSVERRRVEPSPRPDPQEPPAPESQALPKPEAQGRMRVEEIKAERPPTRFALLVGVNEYDLAQDLKYCVSDVKGLYERLLQVGYEEVDVRLLVSGSDEERLLPTKNRIEHQFDIMLGSVNEGDSVLVMLSGHGFHRNDESYFCPADTNTEKPETMITLSHLFDKLDRSKAQYSLLIVDACREELPEGGARSATDHAKSMASFTKSLGADPSGIAKLSSCDELQKSWESSDLNHGVFMNYVIEGLGGRADAERGNRDGMVSLSELHEFASQNTRKFVIEQFNRLQTPMLFGNVPGDWNLSDVAINPGLVDKVDEAVRLYEQGEYRQAIDSFDAVIKEYERFGSLAVGEANQSAWTNAYAFRGRSRLQLGDYPSAISDFSKAIEKGFEGASIHGLRGVANHLIGNLVEAKSGYDTAIAVSPETSSYYFNRALLHDRLGDQNKAIADYTKVVSLDPDDAEAYLNRGAARCNRGDTNVQEALDDFVKAANADTSCSEAFLNAGLIFCDQRKTDSAIDWLSRAIETSESPALAYCYRAFAHKMKRDYSRSLSDCQKAIELDPQNELAYCIRADIQRFNGRYSEALPDYNKAIQLNPKNPAALINRAIVRGLLHDNSGAVADYKEAVKLAPNDPFVICGQALVHIHIEGNSSACISACSRALRIDPNFKLAYGIQGYAYFRARQIRAADQVYRNIRGSTMSSSELSYVDTARKAVMRKQWSTAILYFIRALDLNPRNSSIGSFDGLLKHKFARTEKLREEV